MCYKEQDAVKHPRRRSSLSRALKHEQELTRQRLLEKNWSRTGGTGSGQVDQHVEKQREPQRISLTGRWPGETSPKCDGRRSETGPQKEVTAASLGTCAHARPLRIVVIESLRACIWFSAALLTLCIFKSPLTPFLLGKTLASATLFSSPCSPLLPFPCKSLNTFSPS